jgi:formamidopyrimidine-DNA glycosylase
MPELPEVENFARSLAQIMVGKTILRVQFHRTDIRSPLDVKALRAVLCANETVENVDRLGKKLRFKTSKGIVLVGLGMSGSFEERSGHKHPLKHEHVTLVFTDGTAVGYLDPRRFGSWEAYASNKKSLDSVFSAADPLVAESLGRVFLSASWQKSHRRIWDALLDQKKIGGLGNIYALEALFSCGVHPATPCQNVPGHALLKLALVIPPLLKLAIEKGGSSISSYRNFDGAKGDFQNAHRVYGRSGKPCLVCETTLVREVFGSRGVYLCPTCQPKITTVKSKLANVSQKKWKVLGSEFVWKPGQHVELVPLQILKPWGKEIWYSGIEKRGVNCVRNQLGQELSLPKFMEIHLGSAGVKSSAQVPLLKILDPKPVAVLGDLYTEVHSVKNEVYVCLEVDPILYPEGDGLLRYGLQIEGDGSELSNVEEWKRHYLKSVQKYQSLRQQIDSQLELAGVYQNGQPEAEVLLKILSDLPVSLKKQETMLRNQMNAFTAVHSFPVGSFARVPAGVPHALQAGVKVVEFQTNSYERWIVSFAQKVATQNHWDTSLALKNLDEKASLRDPIQKLASNGFLTLLALFEEYALFHLSPQSLDLSECAQWGAYCVAFALPGSVVTLDGVRVRSEGFIFVAGHHSQIQVEGGRGVLLAFAPL